MHQAKPMIVHLTTLHDRDDLRIYLKECITLQDAGYRIEQVVADGKSSAERNGIAVHDVGKASNRFLRMCVLPIRAYRKIRQLDPALVHFHDPELLPIAYLMKLRGCRVVYDAHEDLPRAILSKTWIRSWLRKSVSIAVEAVEDFVSSRIDAVVAATPHIADRFAGVASISLAVVNYPLESELQLPTSVQREARTFCFAGNVTRFRGAIEMIKATALSKSRLLLAGPIETGLLKELEAMPEWRFVHYYGQVSREQVHEMMARSVAGLLFYHPEPNHVNALPNKLFEFMSAGLPVLCSDFPFWQSMVDSEGVGYSCSPFDPEAIAALMDRINSDPANARAMGESGRRLVVNNFSWRPEGRKLLALYDELVGGAATDGLADAAEEARQNIA